MKTFKKLSALLLTVCLLIAAAPACFGASLTPQPVTQNGITLGKTAVRTSDTTWDVTLTVRGGGEISTSAPADIVLLLDASSSMARLENGQTRLEIAKEAAKGFIDSLSQKGVNASVALAVFSGTAAQLCGFTPLSDAAALNAAMDTGWYVATSQSGSPAYGNSGGTNIIKALSFGQALLGTGANAAKYLVLLSDGSPSVYGDDEKSSWRTGDGFMSSDDVVANTRADAAALLAANKSTRYFAVGFNVKNMQYFASPSSAYTASGAQLAQVFDGICAQLSQSVQNGIVTDEIGDYFSYADGSAVITPSAAPASVSVDASRRTLVWNTGEYIDAAQIYTLKYTLILNDAQLAGAGADVPLNTAAHLDYTRLNADMTQTAATLDFPVPTELYEAGDLRVFSSGLPEGTLCTQQTARAMCTQSAEFDVIPPMGEPAGYVLSCVKLNGVRMTLNGFVTAYHYKLPVVKGETVVEYCYAPAAEAESWTYSVEYYVNGTLHPDWTYSASVPASNPVVTQVDTRLSSLPNFYEEPVLPLPYTLRYNGEVLRVYYVAVQLPAVMLRINHTYLSGGSTVDGSDSEEINTLFTNTSASAFFKCTRGGHTYTVVSSKLTETTADGVQTTRILQPSELFSQTPGCEYTLNIIYNRPADAPEAPGEPEEPTPTPPAETPTIEVTPVPQPATLPATSGTNPALKAAIGVLAMLCSVALQMKNRKGKRKAVCVARYFL